MQKLSLSFILNQGEKQQQDNLPASIPSTCERRSSFNFPDVEEEEPVHTLLALKNYIVHQHHQQLQLLQQQPQPLASAEEADAPIRQDINTITTTRSSFYLVNTVEGLPLVLPKFRPQETSDDYLFHQHHQQQHQQHLQQQQQLFVPTTTSTLPPFGIPQPESFSPSLVKKRKLADRDLDDSLNEDDEDISANASEEEDKIKTAKKGGQKKEKKKRVRPTREQAAFLDRYFQSNPHPDTPARLKIAQTINMSPKTVCTWFQNKRARERRALKKQKKNNNNTHNSNNTNNSVVFHSDFLQV